MITTLILKARQNIPLSVMVVAALGLLALNPFFYLGWQSAGERQAEVEDREMIANLQLITAQSTYELSTLQAQRDDIQAGINGLTGSTAFPQEAPSTDLYTALSAVAGTSGRQVTLAAVQSSGESGSEEIGDSRYSKFVVDITLEGSLGNIQWFLDKMENSAFPTLRFDDVSLTKDEATSSWQGIVKLVILSGPLAEEA